MVNPLNESPLAFPALEVLHILGFVCGVGGIALVSFRSLGFGLTGKSAAQLWRDTLPWTAGGLTVAIFTGLLLFSINPDVYYLNNAFLFKMCSLALAIVWYFAAGRKSASRLAGAASLVLWTLVICGGIFIGLSAARPPARSAPPSGIDFDQFLNGAGK